MKTIFFILLFLLPIVAYAQFDNTISRYIADSNFTLKYDGNTGREYVDIQPFKINLKTTYTRLYFTSYNDYGSQPIIIISNRDSVVGLDTLHLSPVFFWVKSANAFFSLSGDNVSETQSAGITDNNSNSYDGAHYFLSTKFLYWYFCDKNGITIK